MLPDTRPGVSLDSESICQGCRQASLRRTVDWEARAEAFREVVAAARARGADWDCLIPVSGGKDSFWQTVTCLEHGLRPLAVTYAVPRRTPLGEANLRALVDLGVDHVEIRVNPDVERRFTRLAFERTGIAGLVTHMAIFAMPARLAVAHDIPLVVYGENSAEEYGTDDPRLLGARLDTAWLDRFGVTAGTTAEDWVGEHLTRADLTPFVRPDDAELDAHDIRVIFLGHYHRWDPETSRAVATAHGFRARAEGPRVGHYDYVNIDEDLIGVHHHLKWHKFGITRSWDTLSMEIRAGRMSRDQAIAALRARGDETPWDDIEAFCAYVGLDRGGYFAVAERFRDRDLWVRRDGRWVIEDFLVEDFPWPADPELP